MTKDPPIPKGKFRVIAVDIFAGVRWIVGDFSKKVAIDNAKKESNIFIKTYVYSDKGKLIDSY